MSIPLNIAKIPELRRRLIFTVLMLAVYRIGVHVPTPGVNGAAIAEYFKSQSGTIFGLFNMFSGGALSHLSILALGVMPYISASIIFSLLGIVVPSVDRLQKEGDAGRKKINQYTRYTAILISVVQAFAIASGIQHMGNVGGLPVVYNPGVGFVVVTIITLTCGTAFLMWLGEQITARGIGNGMSLIIFAGIIARLPSGVFETIQSIRTEEMSIIFAVVLLLFMFATISAIVFFERGQRRIPVQYAKRVIGRKMYGGMSSHLPLRINSSGVIPPIFASSILVFPATAFNFISPETLHKSQFLTIIQSLFHSDSVFHNTLYIALIVFFCFFYTAVTFNPIDVADNMKRQGGYIPGIRPGKKTADYIDDVLTRITLGGAVYISVICILPVILSIKANVPFYFGGTGLLIVVGVALDTVAQIEAHLISRNYDGFLGAKGMRFKGRRG